MRMFDWFDSVHLQDRCQKLCPCSIHLNHCNSFLDSFRTNGVFYFYIRNTNLSLENKVVYLKIGNVVI